MRCLEKLASTFPECHWHGLPGVGWDSRVAGPPSKLNRYGRRLIVLMKCRASEGQPTAGAVGQAPFTYRGTVFDELGLDNIQVSSSRVRQHANPLKRDNLIPVGPLPWGEIYEDPTKPLVVDVGSGSGRFLLLMAKQRRLGQNYLGTDIRGALIRRANEWAQHLGVDKSTYYVKANATVSLETMLSNYPGAIKLITVHFPDPHFKKRNRKRRIVQAVFVHAAAKILATGGEVLLQTDVEPVAIYMRKMFEVYGADAFEPSPLHTTRYDDAVFTPPREEIADVTDGSCTDPEFQVDDNDLENLKWKSLNWLECNPLGVPTERELFSQFDGRTIYRLLLRRR